MTLRVLSLSLVGAFSIFFVGDAQVPVHSRDGTNSCASLVENPAAWNSALIQVKSSGPTKGNEEKTGCCCLLKDSGPPPVWDCSGYASGTLVTRAQCKKDADDASAKFKWHEGKCTDKD